MADECNSDASTARDAGDKAPRGSAEAKWSVGAKTGVGTAATMSSRVWYTLSHGSVDEIYYPDVDKANTRSLRFLVADGEDYFSDEEADAEHHVEMLETGVPGYRVTSVDKRGRFRLHKEIIGDPERNTLIVRVRLEPLTQEKRLHLYVFVEPQVDNKGSDNDGWLAHYLDVPMLFAQRGAIALAVACNRPFVQRTCGYTGTSDALTQLREHRRLTKLYTDAPAGKVALCGEIDLEAIEGECLISVGFGAAPDEAALLARASVSRPFDEALAIFTNQWKEHQAMHLALPCGSEQEAFVYRASIAMLTSHELRMFPGGSVASLSIPWGFSKGDEEVVGYHVLWPRDMVHSALGKLASGDAASARRTVFYLTCTQRADGSWSQNMWKSGKQHWKSVQMDTIAMPILLADMLRRENSLQAHDAWPMVRGAAEYLLKFGPATEQERWEKLAGFSASSIPAQVAALLAAADFAETVGQHAYAGLMRETADAWNVLVDDFFYVQGGDLAEKHGVAGYYMRIAPPEILEAASQAALRVKLSDIEGQQEHAAIEVISPDALALVRLGLRSANDPRILDTMKVIDETLRYEMKSGKGWVRSTFDGYGEDADGRPYAETGIGRCWPLLAGERGHCAIAGGDETFAREMLATMARQTSECGMLPEQVWNAADIPERELFNGRANGSSMPLAWAHSEYIRLLRSLRDGAVWDMPPQTVERYQTGQPNSSLQIWTEACPRKWINVNRTLRIDLNDASTVTWRIGDGERHTAETMAPRMQLHSVYLPTESAPQGTVVQVKVRKSTGEILHLDLKVNASR
jgi:glucoamylase